MADQVHHRIHGDIGVFLFAIAFALSGRGRADFCLSASARRRFISSACCWASGSTKEGQHQRGHAFEQFRIAPKNVEGLIEDFTLIAAIHKHRVQGPIEILAIVDSDGFDSLDAFDHLAGANRQSGRSQNAREMHDVGRNFPRIHILDIVEFVEPGLGIQGRPCLVGDGLLGHGSAGCQLRGRDLALDLVEDF